MNIYSIYKATNIITNKVYIGFCSDFNKRLYRHKYNALNTKRNQYFYLSIRKYGIENFNFEEIYVSLDKYHCLQVMESYFIKEYDSANTGYNMTIGGEGCLNYKHSDSVRKTLSHIGTTKIGEKNSFFGKKHKTETIEKNKNKNIETLTKLKGRKIAQYSMDGNLIRLYNSVRSAAREIGRSHPSILNCCKGNLKHAHGFVWKYLDNNTEK